MRFSKSTTPEALHHWSLTKEQIGRQLKRYYQAYATEELPPRLLALIKKLDEETANAARRKFGTLYL